MEKRRYAYQFRLKLNQEQIAQFVQSAGCVRKVWNYFLAETQAREDKKYTGYEHQAKALTVLKKEEAFSYLNYAPSQALQQTLKNLSQAFKAFFEKRAAYPVFKKKSNYKVIHFPQGFKLTGEGKIFLPKLGRVDFIQHRTIHPDFKIKNVYIRQKGKHFDITLQGEQAVVLPKITLRKMCGLDLGIKHFLVSSKKEFLSPLNKYQHNLEKLKFLQRKLSLKTKGSRSWHKVHIQLTQLHHHIANCRKDFNHKLSRYFADCYDIIVCEKLSIQKMLEKGSAKLNLQILDQGWYQFKTFLSYKLAWQGKQLIEVNPAYTSQTCSHCGHIAKANRLTQASFCCVKCGLTLNADENASRNILLKGFQQLNTLEQGGVVAFAIAEATSFKEW